MRKPEKLRDPRIPRLAGLVHELLADYERSTGRLAEQAPRKWFTRTTS
jgi:hypothetical protein